MTAKVLAVVPPSMVSVADAPSAAITTFVIAGPVDGLKSKLAPVKSGILTIPAAPSLIACTTTVPVDTAVTRPLAVMWQ